MTESSLQRFVYVGPLMDESEGSTLFDILAIFSHFFASFNNLVIYRPFLWFWVILGICIDCKTT